MIATQMTPYVRARPSGKWRCKKILPAINPSQITLRAKSIRPSRPIKTSGYRSASQTINAPKINNIATEEIQYNIFLEFDKQGEVIDLNRDLKRNTELLNNKIKNNSWSNDALRFKWYRIL